MLECVILASMKRLAVAVLAGVYGLAALAQSPGKFVATGTMTTPREGNTATLLKDGRVLITGGYTEDARGKGTTLQSTELYDPATGVFTPAGDMTIARSGHAATLLSDGRVLITGGASGSAELYDPATGLFTGSKSITEAHNSPAANLLSNGKVLISGWPSTELYDPATDVFTDLGPADNYGRDSTALLPDGRVLIPGNHAISLFKIAGDSLKLVVSLPGSYVYQTTTVLAKGKVLIAGGGGASWDATLNEASLYDPRGGTLETTGLMLFSRESHTATLLPDGHVLIVGGYDGDGYNTGIPSLTDAEEYDPSTGSFTSAGRLVYLRDGHTATLLPDGTVLIAGGSPNVPIAELYVPPLRAASAASLTGSLAPGSQASLFGSRLAGATVSADPLSPLTGLGGISLRLVDSSGATRLARLLRVSPSQIDFEVPAGTAAGKVTLEIVNAPAQLPQASAQIDSVAPALFTHDDNTVVAYTARIESHQIRVADRPVQLILFATGIRNRSSLANVQCTIGGISVPVDYAGPNDNGVPGLDQVNLRLMPALKPGFADLVLTVDGVPSNTVYVFVPNYRR